MQNEQELEQDELNPEVEPEQDDEHEPEVSRAIAYLTAKIKTKQKALEAEMRQAPQSRSFEDTFKVFLHIFQLLILQNEIKHAQRNIQRLQSPMVDNTESLMERVLHEQRTEQQVKMTNMMIDTILEHWILTPLRLLLPQVVKDDLSKLIVGIGSMFGSENTEHFEAEVDDDREQHALNR
jgi:hypothetical protein